MRRFFGLLVILVVLGLGATIGVLGRAWLDRPAPGRFGANPGPDQRRRWPSPRPLPRRPRRPPPAASPRDTVVEITESELQAQVNTMLVGRSLGSTPLGDATIQSATVALRDRQIKVNGTARAGVLNAPFTAAGTIVPDGNGRPLVRMNEATVGGVVLPGGARSALADTLQTQVDRLFADRAIKVREIEIADGKMRVVGTDRRVTSPPTPLLRGEGRQTRTCR